MTSRLILSGDLTEFFRDEVKEARSDLGIDLKDSTEYYLVNLLCDFSHRKTAPTPGEEPLAFIYKRSLEASPLERLQILKDLGDLALYVAGFFAEFVEKSLVDVSYYISMGGSAYHSLSDLHGQKPKGDTFAELYAQLGHQFTELVDLLNEIAERTRGANNSHQNLMRLYDRWARTKSERMQRRLVENGLLTTFVPDTDVH